MPKVTITLPDGSKKEFEKGVTALEVAKSIGSRLADAALAAKVNGELVDLTRPIEGNAEIKILTWDDQEGRDVFYHSSAHLMANAVMELRPHAKLTIGPTTEDGFYYDFETEPFIPEDLKKIEKRMEELQQKNIPIKRLELTKTEGKRMFKDNKFKQEIIDEFVIGNNVTAYQQGDFTDLCRGPHLPSTGKIKSFKLTKLSSSYWRGDAKNPVLQRIYGVSFPSKKQLEDYMKLLEEAEKRDHRKIGREMDLFMFHEFSPGSPFFLPNGTIIYKELMEFLRQEYKKRGYQEVMTPLLYDKALWETSGHWQHFKQNMFILNVDDRDFAMKPMNCPSHLLIFKNGIKSYKDLPLRIADFAPLHRNEVRGTLGGLTRVRKMSQDDAHCFVMPEQIEDEIGRLLDFFKYIYTEVFDFSYTVNLSTRPDDFMGDAKIWDMAEKSLARALDKKGIKHVVKEKEGAFYGPKIDIDVKDALGRSWQVATIQLDFQMPMRFEAVYEGADGRKHTPVMIHRALLGSLERFIGVMVEHFAGKFPLWLAPVQVVICNIADRHRDYAVKVHDLLKNAGMRVELDDRAESIPKKVRDNEMKHINYILVVGDKEMQNHTVNVRSMDNAVHGEKKVDEFLSDIKSEIQKKMLKSVYSK